MSRFLFIPFVAALLLTSACDSGDPIDEPHPRDVAGLYQFTTFTFFPTGPAFQPIVVLDTLVAAQTDLRLSSGGNFILSYQFVAGELFFLQGDFEVTARTVRIRGRRNDRDSFNRLLLEEDFTLRRDPEEPGVLTAELPRTIDPSAFSDRYRGVESMSGTLHIRLVRQ